MLPTGLALALLAPLGRTGCVASSQLTASELAGVVQLQWEDVAWALGLQAWQLPRVYW